MTMYIIGGNTCRASHNEADYLYMQHATIATFGMFFEGGKVGYKVPQH